jgi:hypothetical protein
MTWQERYLTIRWNNILTFALGIPAFLFVAWALVTGLWMTNTGFIGVAIVGVVY